MGHFLVKPGTNGVVNVCGKAVNQGGGLGMEIPCEYVHYTAQTKSISPRSVRDMLLLKLIEHLDKCLDLRENPAVRKESLSTENVPEKRGRKRKSTTGESSKNKKS